MVKRRRVSHRRVSGKGYNKKCVLSVIRRHKISTPKQLSMAFKKARKHCHIKKTKVSARRVGAKRRKGRKGVRKCKYGHRKGSKRCRKTPRRSRR